MRRADKPPPACYALVHPGLEPVAADEITGDLGGEVKRSGRGVVVFRTSDIDDRLLHLRTTEDVFVLAWGTDQLTHRAEDLERIRRWTAREPDWPELLRLHHLLRPRPRGKPTYRLVTQMEGQHVYQRKAARQALAEGLQGHLPASWPHVEENAAVEIWLTIQGATAVCGVRLSDRSMRHRTYKLEHRPASLRPTLAAAMVRLAEARPSSVFVDPMCGAGTILAEWLATVRDQRGATPRVLGGDVEFAAIRAAALNLRRLGPNLLCRWDARRLPLADGVVDRVVSNPPFGKQLADPGAIRPLYAAMVREYARVLKPDGRAVLLVSDQAALQQAARAAGWQSLRQLTVRILGQKSVVSLWRNARS
jgi:23S rRNA G2445 N2-methylase RlmL